MNALVEKYSDRLEVVAFPCNQFGSQNYSASLEEHTNSLKYVRPGNGYVANFPVMQMSEVNGAKEPEFWTWLKAALPAPDDDNASFISGKFAHWAPVKRTDVAWNFEKFLFNADGTPFKRYSRFFETINIAEDIDQLLAQ
jgi:glutathione peroxidase